MKHIDFWAFYALEILFTVLVGVSAVLGAVFTPFPILSAIAWFAAVVMFVDTIRKVRKIKFIREKLYAMDYAEKRLMELAELIEGIGNHKSDSADVSKYILDNYNEVDEALKRMGGDFQA